jgi:hypothetical protein
MTEADADLFFGREGRGFGKRLMRYSHDLANAVREGLMSLDGA